MASWERSKNKQEVITSLKLAEERTMETRYEFTLWVLLMCAMVVTGCTPQYYTAPSAARTHSSAVRSTTPSNATGGTRGHMEGVVIAYHTLLIEGFVHIKGRPGDGFVAGLAFRGSDTKYLPRKEVSGRFSVRYDLSDYVGWEYSITLYAHEADEAGRSKVLARLTGVHR